MKLILVCATVVLLISVVELQMRKSQNRRRNTIMDIYRRNNVTPVPETLLGVYFDDVNITAGMEICPEQAQFLPTIEFDCDSGRQYTMVAMSPDWPSREDQSLSASLLGIYSNIRCNSDCMVMPNASSEVSRWIGPIPGPCTGLHRYLLYVFEQREYLDTNDAGLQRLQSVTVLFSLIDFLRTYNLVRTPVAGNMFKAQYPVNNCNCGCD